ncbi:hypothetical protein LB503_006186 [Fusarium chuoi]|nr:hypothetical protein LB503_006186 [Fusarium chuoi]
MAVHLKRTVPLNLSSLSGYPIQAHMDTVMNNGGPGPGLQSQADLPWDSLIDTFPFLTNQAYQALSIQLEFFRNISTMNLPMPQDASVNEKLTVILNKASIVNDLMSSLTHSAKLLVDLKNIEYDEVVNARRDEVSSMLDEAGDNIGKVIAMQTKEVERGSGQQDAEIQEQQRRAEQESILQQRIGGLGMGAPEPPGTQMPYVQPPAPQQSHMPQQSIIPEQIPGLHHASVPSARPQGYTPPPLNNAVPAYPQAPAHPEAPVLGPAPGHLQASGHGHLPTHSQVPAHAQPPGHNQYPAHPLPQPVPPQRQDSVYTETSTTSSDDSEIRRMLAAELKKQKQKHRAAKRMAKMKRERQRGDFCKRCGRC